MTPSLDWMHDARCKEIGGEPFFPEPGGDSEPAKRICRQCPVQTECLSHALTIEESGVWSVMGVWGGTTHKERLRLARRAA